VRKIKLITDSTCDLSNELIDKLDLEVIPLYVNFLNQEYLDGVDIDTKKLYQKVEELNTLPKTSAASPGDFVTVFEKYLNQDYEVIYIGIGSKFSGTFNSANVARNILGKEHIYLIDSMNLSSGIGLLLLKTHTMIEAGKEVNEIVREMEDIVPKVRSQFVIDTLDYLYKGGRLNALSAIAGKVLHIHPIIKVKDGAMLVGKKVRGTMKKAIMAMVDEAKEIKGNIDSEFMMITHSMAYDTYPMVKKEIDDHFEIKDVYETSAGCVISTHCGKGTIGILYIEK
jgi:DegV family protein with EDD domain